MNYIWECFYPEQKQTQLKIMIYSSNIEIFLEKVKAI